MKSKLKNLSLILLTALCMLFFTLFANAVDNIEWTLRYNGNCGKSNLSVQWKYHTHSQYVSDSYYNNRFTLAANPGQDSGVMENYVYKNFDYYSQYASNGIRKWNSIFPNIYIINIEEGMKVIGDHAFNFGISYNGISSNLIPYPEDSSSNVRYFFLPSTLEEIGFCGFAGALRYVETLTLPANLSTLDYGAFCGNGFSTIVIEEGNLATIPSYCFANCTSLKEIYIPKSVKTIDSSAFMGCTSLQTIHYGGYSEDWEKITIYGNNDALLSAKISFPIRVHVSSVSLNETSKTLMAGNTFTLVATVLPSNADIKDVIWTSSNPNVASVSDSGVVTAVSAGTTQITATSVEGGVSASCIVSVQAANTAVTDIAIDKTSISLFVDETETLLATLLPTNATNKNVTWSSSDTSVATVSNGKVTAVSSGTAIITVKTEDGGKTAQCSVTVTKKVDSDSVKFNLNDVSGTPGKIIEVTLSVENNSGFAGVDLYLDFDNNYLIPESVALVNSVPSMSITSNLSNPNVIKEDLSRISAIIYRTDDITYNGELLKFRFKIKDGVKDGNTEISISNLDVTTSKLETVDVDSRNGTVSIVSYVCGDATGDGDVTIQDLVCVAQYLAGWNVEIQESAANCDGKNGVTIQDLVLLAQYLAGWDVELIS